MVNTPPPEMTVERAWTRGLKVGRYKAVEDLLDAALEAVLQLYANPERLKKELPALGYKLITPDRAYVMRSKPGPAAKLLPSAHAVDREFRVISALCGTGFPVAQPVCFCADRAVIEW